MRTAPDPDRTPVAPGYHATTGHVQAAARAAGQERQRIEAALKRIDTGVLTCISRAQKVKRSKK